MEYSYKFRLYPNKTQEEYIIKTFGCCRYVFNYYLTARKKAYEENGETMNYYACCKDLTLLKESLEWLREPDSSTLQNALRDLDRAYQNFFRRVKHGEKPGYPRYKSRYDYSQSFRTSRVKVLDKKHIQLPKLGVVRCVVSKPVEGRPLSATISKTSSGKYFVAICCTEVEIEPMKQTGAAIGVSMGAKNFATTSDGTQFPNPKYMEKNEKRLAMLQRRLSRQQKGSGRYEKTRIQIAKLHEHIANKRADTLHKLSTQLVRENDVICVQDMDIQDMLKDHAVAKNLSDAAWGEFRRQLDYKGAWYKKEVLHVKKDYEAARTCSNCGAVTSEMLDPAAPTWTCPVCGRTHDLSENAAVNILQEGLREATGQEKPVAKPSAKKPATKKKKAEGIPA